MSFPLLICSNCDKDVNNDSFLLLEYNNEKELKKNNQEDVSFSDINNSTNNYLEIIDYPYSLNNNQIESNNENDLSEQIYYPVKTEEKKRKFDDFDDDLLDIKPPKLFTKANKDKIEEKKEVFQVIKTEPEEPKDKILNIETNNYISNDQYFDIKMNSNKSESLINNDNSIMNNKFLLRNYYKNYTINSDIPDEMKNIKDKFKESIKRNLTDINNTINNNINNKIIGLKVDYPCPDLDSFHFKSKAEPSKNTLEATKFQENTNKTIQNNKENEIKKGKKIFLKKINKIHIEKDNKTKKIIEFNLAKQKIKALSTYNVNINKIKAKFEKKKNIKNNNNKNQIIEKKKKLTFNSLSNFNNKFKLKAKKTSDDVSEFFHNTENHKFTKSNNILLESIINKKINDRNKNIFKSYFEKRKKVDKSYIHRDANKTNIFSTKYYTNPFIAIFDY